MSLDSRKVSTHCSDYSTASCTVITADHKITKTYEKRDGVVCKTVAAQFSKATAHRVTFASATDFAATINSLTTNQALMHGVYERDITDVYSKKRFDRLDDQTHAATRTKAHTAWPAGGGVLVLDYDAPDAGQALQLDQLRSVISELLPLGQLAYVTAYSSSSFIYDDKQQYSGSKGLRVYILVKDAQDIPRAGKVLFDRLWLAGHGFFVISKSGGLLNRSIVDASVWQPSRLDFASGAHCVAPITQQRPPAAAYDGALLDTQTALPDLSEHEQQQLDAMFTAERSRLKPVAERIRGVYIEDRAKQQLDRDGVQNANPAQIAAVKQQIERSLDGGVLHADWLVMLADRSLVTVADIFADRAKYHGVTCKDPIEHDYNDYHTCAVIYTDRDSVTIVSHAHGQRTYECSHVNAQIGTRAQAWGAIQHAKECQTRFNDALADWKERFSTAADALGADATRDLIRDSGKAALVGAEPVAEDFLDTLAHAAKYFEALRKAARGVLLEHPTLDDAFASVTAHESIDDASAMYLRELVKNDHDRRTRDLSKLIDISDATRASDAYTLISDFNDVTNYKRGVIAVRAGMGTGKTRIVAKAYREIASETGVQFLALTHRAALCAELSRVLNCVSYSDVKAEKTKGRTDADIFAFFACCVNSINRADILQHVKQPKIIVIDEVGQLRKHFAGIYDQDVGTAGQASPASVYERFVDLLRCADTVVVLDAGIAEIDLDWLRSIRTDVTVYEHVTRSGDGLRVTLKWSKKMHVKIGAFDEIAERLKEGQNIWVSVGERAIGDALLERVGDKYKHIWIHANTPTALKNKILNDVDGQSKGVQLFIASPTISSGISVTHDDDPHFDAVYVIGNGSGAGADDLIQMLRRVRYVTDLNLVTWQVDRDIGTSDAALLHDVGQTESSNDTLYTLRQHINAQRNAGRADFKYTIALALANAGFDVVPEKMGGNLRRLGEINEALRKTKALRLNSAPVLRSADYHELKNGRYKTAQDFDAIEAYELRDRLNLSEVEAITDDDVKLYAGGYCRDALARVAAVHGIALDTRENTHTLVKLYAIIFEGVEIRDLFNKWGLLELEPQLCKRIATNAIRCGREGVAFEVLPQNYRRKDVQINNPVRTVRKILEYAGILSSNDTFTIYKRVSLLDSSKRDNVYVSDTPPAYLDLRNKAFSLVGISFDTDCAKDRVTQRRVHERHFSIVSSNDTFLYADVSSNDTFLSGGVSSNDTFYNKTRPATAQPIEVRLKNCPPFTIYPPS